MSENHLAATLELPKGVRIHPIVHVNRWKPYKGETSPDGQPVAEQAAKYFGIESEPLNAGNRAQEELQIETILAWRDVHSIRAPHKVMRQELLVNWSGQGDEDNT